MLIQLLKNYSRSFSMKKSIAVGVIGYAIRSFDPSIHLIFVVFLSHHHPHYYDDRIYSLTLSYAHALEILIDLVTPTSVRAV